MSYRHPSGVRTMYGSALTAGAGPDPCTPISPSSCRNTDPPNPTMACTPPGQPRHGQTIHDIGMVARDLLAWRPKLAMALMLRSAREPSSLIDRILAGSLSKPYTNPTPPAHQLDRQASAAPPK